MTATATVPTLRASHLASGQMLFGTRVDVPAAAAHAVTADDVCDLLVAAGPLTLCDIAGGLAVPVRRAAASIRQMVARRDLKKDEFGRYRLCGACASR